MSGESDKSREVSGSTDQTIGEEIANSITHGIGVALSIAGLVLLVVFSSLYGDAWRVVTFSIYGATLIILYLASTLYHGFTNPKVKHFFRVMDHASIYLLIAGSYTPITLTVMRGPWGWTLFGLIWGMAIAGIITKFFIINKLKILSVLFYIAMGWLVVIAIKPMLIMAPKGLIVWLVIGGLSYTFGIIFYALDKMPYSHTIWHLFVMGGSISHFFGMFFNLTRV
ncbi:MAG: hemolysin III family protein [Deltaproteobacteria bacterium]|uniref:Hemolysin III family protein n=1 Tax=Candidatus Zymogenus saltonus TaxID=2844893 RepID=A0A9D8KDQ6_9DELT|nr:hemolysin III family protein [Candidatus Zymogenus saltonus]